ncbi:PulJ/GspJ family protein [Comamonas composti]|uniref:PulJ/GspJ family protein n=1 Tax=Comamonas composti TaxID=408558 RepID=UPI0004218EF1|nr:prepilin-type N-terminal cleavage/methylation domain-containing protein [Comamonas composti]
MRYSRSCTRHGTAGGFTLVELMVAIAIMALLALMSWRGLDGMARSQEATRERGQQLIALQTVLAQWNADLDALMPLEQTQAIHWDGQVLRLTRKSSALIDEGALVVAWARRQHNGQNHWLRWQSPPLRTRAQWRQAWSQAAQWGRSPADDLRQGEVALIPLAQWQLYYYRNNAWTHPQSAGDDNAQLPPTPGTPVTPGTPNTPGNAGKPGSLPGLPDGVRLELTLPEGSAVAGRITMDWVNPLRSNQRS